MEFSQEIIVAAGEPKSISTPLAELTVSYEAGVLSYSRPPLAEADEALEKTFLLEQADTPPVLSYLPVYPDRPIIFRVEDDLVVPPGEQGVFCLEFEIGVGLTICDRETLIEELLARPRKNSYWGPPTEGVLAYQYRSQLAHDPVELAGNTDRLVCVLPVQFINRRDEVQEVTSCLVPLRELDIYRTDAGDLIFEVVQLEQQGENDQVPRPDKRPPSEFGDSLEKLVTAPNKPQTLLDRVSKFSGWSQLSGVFFER